MKSDEKVPALVQNVRDLLLYSYKQIHPIAQIVRLTQALRHLIVSFPVSNHLFVCLRPDSAVLDTVFCRSSQKATSSPSSLHYHIKRITIWSIFPMIFHIRRSQKFKLLV